MVTPSNTLPILAAVTGANDNAIQSSAQHNAPAGSGMRFADRFDTALQARKTDATPPTDTRKTEEAPKPDTTEPAPSETRDTPNDRSETTESAAARTEKTDARDESDTHRAKSETSESPVNPAVAAGAVQANLVTTTATPDSAKTATISLVVTANTQATPANGQKTAANGVPTAAIPITPTVTGHAANQTANPAAIANAAAGPTAANPAQSALAAASPASKTGQPNAQTTPATTPPAPQTTASAHVTTANPNAATTTATLAPTAPSVTPTPPGNTVDSRPTASAAAPGTVSANTILAAPLVPATNGAKTETNAASAPTAAASLAGQTAQNRAANLAPAPAAASGTAENATGTSSALQTAGVPENSGAAQAVQTGDALAKMQAIGPSVSAKSETSALSGSVGKAALPPNAVTGRAVPVQTTNAAAALPSAFETPTANAANANPLPAPFNDAGQNMAPSLTFNLAALVNETVTSAKGETTATAPPVSGTTTAATFAVVRESGESSGSHSESHADTGRNGSNGGSQTESNARIVPPAPETSGNAAASANVTAAAGAKSTAVADRAEIVAQVTRHLESMKLAHGRGEVSFTLTPDRLGSLRVTISSHADGIIARVVAEHAHVQQALESSRSALRNALEQRGLHLDKLEIRVGPETHTGGQAGNGARQAFQERQDTPAFRSASGSGARSEKISAEAVPVSAVTTTSGASRLDYRA